MPRAAGLGERAAVVRDRLRTPESLGLDGFRRSGSGWFWRCPLHEDGTPSFSIREHADGIGWRCFAGCGSGDVLGLLARMHGLSTRGPDFVRVLELAERMAGVVPGEAPPPSVKPKRRTEPEPDCTAAREAQRLVHEVLLDLAPLHAEPEVAAYVEERGFLLDELGDWCGLPKPGDQRRLVAAIVERIGADAWRASGLADWSAGFSHPAARLVIPWRGRGVDGEVHFLQRRPIRPEGPKYTGPRGLTPAWPFGIGDFDELAGPDTELAIVEGALDAVALTALARIDGDDRIAIGVQGVDGWRREWAELGKGRKVVIAFDDDEAGDKRVKKIRDELRNAGAASVQRYRPEGGDWADLLREERRGSGAGERMSG